MEMFEKVGDFKKAVKNLVRGAVKAGVFTDDGKFEFEVTKTDGDEKTVTVAITNGVYNFEVTGVACTRVFNKVDAAIFEPIIAQFSKLKKVESIKFNL